MYPSVPAESVAATIQYLFCFFSVLATMIGFLLARNA